MSKRRQATASIVLVGMALMAISSAAAAQRPGPRVWVRDFDNVWIDRAGVDAFTAAPGDRDLLIALDGDDVLDAGDRRDLIYGDGGDDAIMAGPGSDGVRGGPGDDDIAAGGGWDRVAGGRGADEIDGGPGVDRLFGEGGRDVITGGRGPDFIEGGYGNDTIDVVDGRRDLVRCGPGTDSVTADPQDMLRGCEAVVRVSP